MYYPHLDITGEVSISNFRLKKRRNNEDLSFTKYLRNSDFILKILLVENRGFLPIFFYGFFFKFNLGSIVKAITEKI